MAGVDYYDLLGVSPQASPAEVKSAYRRLAKALHPDAGGNSALFRLVTEAYDALGDPERRQRYDLDRAAPAGPDTTGAAPRAEPPRSPQPHPQPDPTGPDATAPGPGDEAGPGATGTPDTEQPGAGDEGGAAARPNPASLTWWDQVEPAAGIVWIPPFGRWRAPFLISATAWLLLLALLLGPAVSRRGGLSFLDVLALVPVSYVLAATIGWRLPRPLIIAAYLWAVGFGAFGIYTLRDSLLGGAWMLSLALGTLLLPRLGQRYLAHRTMDRVFTREFRHFNIFGQPGTATGESGNPPAASGSELTGDLLSEYLTRPPGARIFHRLAVPGPTAGEVDHAVLCGHRLVLINSMVWEPAHYAIDEFGNLRRDGRTTSSRVTEFPEILESYRTLLPRLEIQGVVLVHASRPGELVCSAPLHSPVAMMTPSSFVQTIGEWLAETPYVVDRDAFLTVLGQLVH